MARWLRIPLLQCTTISLSRLSSPMRCGSDDKGISTLPGIRLI